jgi:hypothetical protein
MTRALASLLLALGAICGPCHEGFSDDKLPQAMKLLMSEARQAAKDGRLQRTTADFAATFEGETSPTRLAQEILQRQGTDPFIDAYVRWQLTSFAPKVDWSALDSREFQRMLTALPPLIENPRADRSIFSKFDEAARSAPLGAEVQARLSLSIEELARRTDQALALNAAALGLRDWLQAQLEEDTERTLALRLERCGAMIRAGWNVEALKQQIDESCAKAARAEGFSAEGRQAVAKLAQQLVDRRRIYLAEARIENASLVLQYDEAAVYDFDVRKWVKKIAEPD